MKRKEMKKRKHPELKQTAPGVWVTSKETRMPMYGYIIKCPDCNYEGIETCSKTDHLACHCSDCNAHP